MPERILVRYGDLVLKGRNKKQFIRTAIQRVKEKMSSPKVTVENDHDRLYVVLHGEDHERVIRDLNFVAGLASYSLVERSGKDLDAIKKTAQKVVDARVERPTTFKVEAKRSDKSYPLNSIELAQHVARDILPSNPYLKADVHDPELTLHVEIRHDAAYLFADKIPGIGGFPVGTMGKGLAMISGGIDSPVAAFLAMKKGIDLELIHFESTPLTPVESAQKTIDISQKLSRYAKENTITLHMVPFLDMHRTILDLVPTPYHITIMRRMMVRIASRYAEARHYPVLINGESIGQVASQTLPSMLLSDQVASPAVIRPLATYDKKDIVALSEAIGTYEISIRPFEDCCQVYVPKSPATKPRDYIAGRYENLFDHQALVDAALQGIRTLTVTPEDAPCLPDKGFSVAEALGEDDA